MSFNFSVSVLIWSFAVSLLPSVHAQIPGYDYIGQTVTKKIKATGEVVGSGELLKRPGIQS